MGLVDFSFMLRILHETGIYVGYKFIFYFNIYLKDELTNIN